MSKPAFTPGDWKDFIFDGVSVVRAVYQNDLGQRVTAFVATCNAGAQDNAANARLCAAAPDMYEALKAIKSEWDAGNFSREPSLYNSLNAALAKAEGRS